MANTSIGLPPEVHAYLLERGVREPEILGRLRDETARLPEHGMQIAPEQGALLAMLVRLIDARRCIEVGTFTGYSSLSVALALPSDGQLICCDVSEEWTSIARRYWSEAGVADRVELRLGDAVATLDGLIDGGATGTFDFAFVDADKTQYPDYHERLLRLVRTGGLVAYDNVLWSGRVADPADRDADTEGIRRLNDRLATDERVDITMLPIGDGLTLARKR